MFKLIQLFNVNNHIIDTSKFSNLLHDKNVIELEEKIANYVGAKYACSVNSATNAIFLSMLDKNTTVNLPSVIPPVVATAILTSGNQIFFIDDVDWVGDSYVLHEFEDYKIVDSAQKLQRNQFKEECNPKDLMIFSFYPTKPLGGSDGGMIVTDDYEKYKWFKEAVLNGTTFANNNWERSISFPGYKMYMNSIQANILMNNGDRGASSILDESLKSEGNDFLKPRLTISKALSYISEGNYNQASKLLASLKNSDEVSSIEKNKIEELAAYCNTKN